MASALKNPISRIYFENLLFVPSLILTAEFELADGKFPVSNLQLIRLEPGFRWDTTINTIKGTLTGVSKMDAFIIERHHTLTTGNTVKIWLSNVSPDFADREELHEFTVITPGKALYHSLNGGSYQYFGLEINGINPDFEYMEINWLYFGKVELIAEGYGERGSLPRKHVLVKTPDALKNMRKQKRSEIYFGRNGTQKKVIRDELENLWYELNEWAVNWPFLYTDDDRTAVRIADSTWLVEWQDPDQFKPEWQKVDSDPDNDYFQFPLNLKEIASVGANPLF